MWGRSNQDHRDYKKSFSQTDARRKREQQTIQIRKQQYDDEIHSKRRQASAAAPQINPVGNSKDLSSLVNDIMSDNPQAQFDATQTFRKILSLERNPPIQEVIQTGVVPRFVEFLKWNHNPRLQFEAAWAITNVASGTNEHTQVVIKHGAVPILVELLRSEDEEVQEQVVWAIGNIAGDSPNHRDFVLQHGAMGHILHLLKHSVKLSMLRNGTWALSNFCRGKPPPRWELVSVALPVLSRLIYVSDDEVLADACWALSYLSDGKNEHIEQVVQASISRRIVELLMHTTFAVQTPALRTVGNIVTGDDIQTQMIINVGALPALLGLLCSPKKGLRKEACWAISNITAGSRAQIDAVINANIFPPLIQLLANAEFEIKKEAAWAVSNATSHGVPQHIDHLVRQGALKPLCDLLAYTDNRVLSVALEGIDNILKCGYNQTQDPSSPFYNQQNPYVPLIERAGCLERLEHLQDVLKGPLYEKVVDITERYWETFENMQEDPSNAEHFNWGQPSGPGANANIQF